MTELQKQINNSAQIILLSRIWLTKEDNIEHHDKRRQQVFRRITSKD